MASSYQIRNAVELSNQRDDLRKADTEEISILLTASTSSFDPDLVMRQDLKIFLKITTLLKIDIVGNRESSTSYFEARDINRAIKVQTMS